MKPAWQFVDRRSFPAAVALLFCCAGALAAQELQPRAYLPAPVGLNYFGVSYANNAGGLLFDPSLPVEDAHVNASVITLSFGQTLGLMGRTAQVLAVIPYAAADLNGRIAGADQYAYRSGLGDAVFRYAMNIRGAPAMSLRSYSEYRQKTIVGASITVSAPTGQYDPARVINIGANRWAFKPEIGVSHPLGKWILEGALGIWLFTANNRFIGSSVRTQDPMGSFQAHVIRVLPHRTWVAFDGTFYTGARSHIDGRDNSDYQGNARLGATFGLAVSTRQAIKFSFFDGVDTRIGSDIRSFGVSYNLIWMKGR